MGAIFSGVSVTVGMDESLVWCDIRGPEPGIKFGMTRAAWELSAMREWVTNLPIDDFAKQVAMRELEHCEARYDSYLGKLQDANSDKPALILTALFVVMIVLALMLACLALFFGP